MTKTNVALWTKTTKQIFSGVMISQVGGIVYDILKPILELIDFINKPADLGFVGDFFGVKPPAYNSIFDDFGIILVIMQVILFGGSLLYLVGIFGFTKIQPESDGRAMRKVRAGIILSLVGAVLTMIDIPVLPALVNIVGFILMLLGYSALKRSNTFPEKARQGAGRLKGAMIWLIIGFILGLIPVAGGFFRMVCSIVSFFMVLSGWACIKNSKQAEASSQHEQRLSITDKLLYIIPLALLFCMDIWGKIQIFGYIGIYFSQDTIIFCVDEILLSAMLITTLIFALRANPKTKWLALVYVILWFGTVVWNLIRRHNLAEQGVELQPYQFVFYIVLFFEIALLTVVLRDIFKKSNNASIAGVMVVGIMLLSSCNGGNGKNQLEKKSELTSANMTAAKAQGLYGKVKNTGEEFQIKFVHLIGNYFTGFIIIP
ncbi:MAG: hypothetical protein LBH32_11230 [Dysgonamonadaceae bacterium]|jgi:hypothetical protein|nr:hypothetical protein [Dysgonamonadaceae bacterium]